MKNWALLTGSTALLAGSLAAPASAFTFNVEGSVSASASADVLGLSLDESFGLDFSEVVDNNNFGISDEELVSAFSGDTFDLTLSLDFLEPFLPLPIDESLTLEAFDFSIFDISLSVATLSGSIGSFDLELDGSDPDDLTFGLTAPAIAGLSSCLTEACALEGIFSAVAETDLDLLDLISGPVGVGLEGAFNLVSTPLDNTVPEVDTPDEDTPDSETPDVPDAEMPDEDMPEPDPSVPEMPDSSIPDADAPDSDISDSEDSDPVSVPEPMTLLGAAIAMVAGATLTRRDSQ